jgi:hypothetical protein
MATLQQHTALEELYKRVQEVDLKLQYMERREQEGWRVASQQISTIAENSRATGTTVANLELKLSKDVQFIEEQLARDVQGEAASRIETETRLKRIIADEAQTVRSAIAAAERDRFSELDAKVTDITSQLNDLCSSFETRLADMTTQLSRTLDATRKEATTVEEMLLRHKAERERAEMNLLAVVEETCVQLHQQIVQERHERVESQKRLEKILLEMSGRQWVRT